MLFRNVSLLGVVLLTLYGCVNQKKATTWFNNHEQKAAEYCAVKYPIKESVDSSYKVDSFDYNQALFDLSTYADSLLFVLQSKQPDTVVKNGVVTITKYKSLNIDSLRTAISVQIKKSLKPCLDSTLIVNIKRESTARVQALTLSIIAKDDTISKRDLRITNLEGKLSWYKQAFFSLCGLIVVILFIAFRKLLGVRIPFLN